MCKVCKKVPKIMTHDSGTVPSYSIIALSISASILVIIVTSQVGMNSLGNDLNKL